MEPNDHARYTLEGHELVQYLVQRAADDAKAALIERDERRNRRTAFLMSIIALVGVGSLMSALKIFVRGEVDVLHTKFKEQEVAVKEMVDARALVLQNDFRARIETSVDKAVRANIGTVIATLNENDQFEQYAELAAQLPDRLARSTQHGDKEKYVAETLREVLTAAEQLAGIERIARRARFAAATRQIVDAMTRYDRESEINRLDDILGKEMASDQEMARILVDHYGQLVVGSPQPIEALTDEMPRLARYMRAARERNYPEKALLWSLFVEFKRNNYLRTSTTDGLLESSRDLCDADRAEFWFNLYAYVDPRRWMREPTQQGRELARLMDRLQQAYKDAQIDAIMEQNIANSPSLQTRVADLRARNPAWAAPARPLASPPRTPAEAPVRETESTAAPSAAPSTETPDAESAVRPHQANPLR